MADALISGGSEPRGSAVLGPLYLVYAPSSPAQTTTSTYRGSHNSRRRDNSQLRCGAETPARCRAPVAAVRSPIRASARSRARRAWNLSLARGAGRERTRPRPRAMKEPARMTG